MGYVVCSMEKSQNGRSLSPATYYILPTTVTEGNN